MTTREQAMQWWRDFDLNTKEYLMKKYHNRKAFNETSREIEEIWRKESKTEEKELSYILKEATKRTTCASERMGFITAIEWQKEVGLNRLKEQYKKFKSFEYKKEIIPSVYKKHYNDYQAMRLFCLDTQLLSFNDIEVMESEINQSF